MPYFANSEELALIANRAELPGREKAIEAVEAANKALAHLIADNLNLDCQPGTMNPEDGGIITRFRPRYDGQACPNVIHALALPGDWD